MRFLPIFLLPALLSAQPDYFQQELSYAIDAHLDDRAHTLRANLTLDYTNRAPAALDSIVFHLWPRAYGRDETAFARQQLRNGDTDFHFAPDHQRGTLDSLDFRIDGQAATFRFTDDPDIGVLYLPTPLPPNETLRITTPFRVNIPASFSRLGHVGESYQITQWYPKPAVYDRDGWHPMPYLNQGEFYSEFADYTVRLTLPVNYVVAATGVLREEAERQWLLERSDLPARDDFPPSARETKTITYRAERVHDFAWFADKRFVVSHDTLHLRAAAPIDVWSFHTATEADLWQNATDYLKRSTRFFSEHVGTYPYPQVTAVQSDLSAGAGMEYPMITVIGLAGSEAALDEVIAHEVGHNWFYGILASNERDHPWMDEGLTSYYEARYMDRYRPAAANRRSPTPNRDIDFDALGYRYLHRLGRDAPPDTRSDSLSFLNYGVGAYSKPELALREIAKAYGEEQLDAAIASYYQHWQFRHPGPEDLYPHLAELGADAYLRDAMESTYRGAFNTNFSTSPPEREYPRFGILTGPEGERPRLFLSPLVGFNAHDGGMLGLALHNRTLEPRPFEFLLAPLYGIGSGSVVGFAGGRYRIVRPLPAFERVLVGIGGRRFSDFTPTAPAFENDERIYDYTRLTLKTDFVFDHPDIDQRSSRLYSRLIHLRQRRPDFAGNMLLDDAWLETTNFLELGYRTEWKREIDPLGLDVRLEYRNGGENAFTGGNALRLEAELTGGYQYRAGKFIRYRFFGGYFLASDYRELTGTPALSLSLVDNAATDYRYDDLYLGRNEAGWYGQQLERRQGGFRAPIAGGFPFGRSNDYLTAVNLDAQLPIPLPLGLFLDAGMYGDRPTLLAGQSNTVNYVGGLSLTALRQRIGLYLPLVADAATRRLLQQRGNLLDRLSFRLNLSGWLPWRWIDDLP
jgi:hypothetical protein